MNKRKCAVIISLLLTLFCCGFAASNDGPPVTMEVSSIYGDVGKMGVHIPLSVNLYGQSSGTFEGTVEVRTLENAAEEGTEIYEYQYPVTVAMAETKSLDFYVPLGQCSNEFQVALLDSAGKEIASKTMKFDVSKDMGRLLIGALSDRPEEIQYLDGVSLDYGMVQSRMLLLDEENFPEDAKGLEVLDLLVVNNFEADRLSEEQMAAIRAWVEDGGTLLIGTGGMFYSTLGDMAEEFVSLPIGGISYEKINFGAEYDVKAPGDSDVSIPYADFEVPGGRVVEDSDGNPLLTMVDRGAGRVGIYSYDLGSLDWFVEKNTSYANKMLTDVIDEDDLSQLYYYSSYGKDDDYWDAYSLVNKGSADRLPKMGMYSLVIIVYIFVAGPGLYLFLKNRDLSRFYGTSVVIASVAVAAVVYLLGVGTRFTSQFFNFASILELDGETVYETSYMNVRTPDSRPFSVTIPAAYDVVPLTKSSRYNSQVSGEFEDAKDGNVELRFGENGTVISAKKSKAFESRFFKLTKESAAKGWEGISGMVEWYDGKFSGSIVNNMPFALEDAALMLYGQMYLIGDMEPGEVRVFEDEELLVWPVGMSYVVAGTITGRDGTADKTDSEYLRSMEKSSLYSNYIGDKFYGFTSEARLVAAGSDGGVFSEKNLDGQIADGMVLYAADIDVSSGESGVVYRSGLMNKPEVNSGSGAIYGDGLTMYGTEPINVEYFLGTDVEIEKISLLPVSEKFLENPDYYYLKCFDGAAYFYNYTTREYDRIDLTKVHFTVEELRPYLSMEGSIIVKYTVGDSDSAGVSSLLPHLMVTGREN